MSRIRKTRVSLPEAYIAEVETAIQKAIEIADQLIAVTEEETRRLSSGRPETVEDLITRKTKLVDEFNVFLQRYKDERNVFLLASDNRFQELQAKTSHLAKTLLQNEEHLQRAMTANERRIETIMRAVREQQTTISPYGANGIQSHQGRSPVSMHRGCEV